MVETNKNNKLIVEEVKATKLFLWLFYIIFIGYEVFYWYIIPMNSKGIEVGLPGDGLRYWFHFLVLCILPLAIYLFKIDKSYLVKYIIFFGFNIIDLINSVMMYIEKNGEFASGNLVELLFILFTPIFINKRYFWIVSLTLILKYAFYGIFLLGPNGILGMGILAVLSGFAYLFLSRFHSYINTLEKVNEDLRYNEKMALVGQLATSIGHEIKNPLAALKGFIQLQDEKNPHDHEFYQIMQSEIERINLIVSDLLYIGKPKAVILEKNNIKDIIEYVVKMLNHIASSNQVRIDLSLLKEQQIYSDSNQLKQVFINLLKNAIESMPGGGTVKISSIVLENEKQLVLLIEDEGLGIEEDKISMLGKPFYSTKQDGNGLGLMVSYNIIEQHNGKITFNSEIGKGTTVEICLPIELK